MFQAPPGNAPLSLVRVEGRCLNSDFFAWQKKEQVAKIQFEI
jgi:hypothetical protein